MNSHVQIVGDRTIGQEWRTQRGAVDMESRLESRWGQEWRKLIASQRIWIMYRKQWGAMEGFWEEEWQEGEQGDWDGHNVCCRQGRQCEECKCGNGMVLQVSMTVNQQVGHEKSWWVVVVNLLYIGIIGGVLNNAPLYSQPNRQWWDPGHLYYLSSEVIPVWGQDWEWGKRELERQAGPGLRDLEFGGRAKVFCL